MKKDKKWLESVIIKELMTNSGNPDMTTYEQGRVSVLKYYLNLIDQLEEPEKVVVSKMEKVVIPQFVADVLKEYKDNKYKTLYGLFFDVEREMITGEFGDWFVTDGNYEVFCRAWLDGYTIEKETMHYVIFLESEDKEKGQALYKDFNFNGDKVVSTHIEPFSKRIALEAGNFHFTEQEIKAIDERYWAFREEVNENV
ncbi:MAG: DUF1642 domain-containing protein [Carnobacterium inhibens]|uniref:DUF1642 domain-containing protein n=1 Tax=Carnobacterium sp. TaxID=48221 RepID=UPI0033148C02